MHIFNQSESKMASVFEYWGIKKSADTTPIPQLGVDGPVGLLQSKSKKYFEIAKGAEASDGDKLGVTIGAKFSLSNSEHLAFLRESTALVNEKLSQLKSIDKKITGGIVVGVAASCLSFLPLMSLLSWIGWGASLYYMSQRSAAYQEYKEALTVLVANCNWCLGEKKEARQNAINALTDSPEIRNMMTTLYPLLTESQVKNLIADDIEDIFVGEYTRFEERFNSNKFFKDDKDNLALSKKSAEFSRCIYGFNKGGVTDFFDALFSALPDLYRAVVYGFNVAKNWVQEKWNAEPKTETPSLK